MDFATKLKCYRRMLNLTQTDVANAMGINRSTYAYYETGKTVPSSEGVRFLADLFGVSPSIIMGKKSMEPPKPPPHILIFHDSVKETMSVENENILESTFPELSEDEKEMILKYRAMKFAEANLPQNTPNKKGEIIRRFLAEHYK